MFARDPDSALLAMEAVQGVEMRENNITHLGALKWWRRNSFVQLAIDSAEDPWRPVARAADHYSVGTGEIKYLAGFFRAVDVTVGEYRDAYLRLDVANGVVFRTALIKIRARAAVHRERCDAMFLREPCNVHAIALAAVPAGADLERYRHVHRAHHGLQNARHQRLIGEQCRATRLAADFFRRATHVQVDDLRAQGDVGARRLRERLRIGAGELHHARLGLALVIHALARFRRVPQAHVRTQHFRCGKTCAQVAAQDAERAVGDSRHGSEHDPRGQGVTPDLHVAAF